MKLFQNFNKLTNNMKPKKISDIILILFNMHFFKLII